MDGVSGKVGRAQGNGDPRAVRVEGVGTHLLNGKSAPDWREALRRTTLQQMPDAGSFPHAPRSAGQPRS